MKYIITSISNSREYDIVLIGIKNIEKIPFIVDKKKKPFLKINFTTEAYSLRYADSFHRRKTFKEYYQPCEDGNGIFYNDVKGNKIEFKNIIFSPENEIEKNEKIFFEFDQPSDAELFAEMRRSEYEK